MNENQFLYIFEASTIFAPGINHNLDPRLMTTLAALRASADNRFALVAHIPSVGQRTAIKASPHSTRIDYNHLPLPGPTVKHYEKLGRILFGPGQHNPVYLAFAYRNPNGDWGPNPPNLLSTNSKRWRHDWAPPAPEMLNQVLTDTNLLPNQAVLICPDPTQPTFSNWLHAAQAASITSISISNFYLAQAGVTRQ